MPDPAAVGAGPGCRRAGGGGGWPGTFQDILAGIDKLAGLAGLHNLDLSKVVALGRELGVPVPANDAVYKVLRLHRMGQR